MKISALQFQPKLQDKLWNLSTLQDMLEGLDTDLVVLPELAISGYVYATKQQLYPLAEEAGKGEAFVAMQKLSQVYNFSIVYGFPEISGEILYNSSALINPNGSYFIYRKIHLFNREKLLFSGGDKPFAVFPAKNDVMIGMMICFDWQFPEASRSLALSGAQIICHPSNLVLPWCQQAMQLRCLENRVFSITANRTGYEENGELSETFTGCSQILNTKGEVLIRMDSMAKGIETVIIDPDIAKDKQITERNDAFYDRRPAMYRGIT